MRKNSQSFISFVKQIIAKGDISRALDEAQRYYGSSHEMHTRIILYQSQLSQSCQDQRLGLIDRIQLSHEKNRIARALLEDIEQSSIQDSTRFFNDIPSNYHKRTLAFMLVMLVMGGYFFSQDHPIPKSEIERRIEDKVLNFKPIIQPLVTAKEQINNPVESLLLERGIARLEHHHNNDIEALKDGRLNESVQHARQIRETPITHPELVPYYTNTEQKDTAIHNSPSTKNQVVPQTNPIPSGGGGGGKMGRGLPFHEYDAVPRHFIID